MNYTNAKGQIKIGEVIGMCNFLIDNFDEDSAPSAPLPQLILPSTLPLDTRLAFCSEYKQKCEEVQHQHCPTAGELRKQLYDLVDALSRYANFHPEFCPDVIAVKKSVEDRAAELARQQQDQALKKSIADAQADLRKYENEVVEQGVRNYLGRCACYRSDIRRGLVRDAVLTGLYQLCKEYSGWKRIDDFQKIRRVSRNLPAWMQDPCLLMNVSFLPYEYTNLTPEATEKMLALADRVREVTQCSTSDAAVDLAIEKGWVEAFTIEIIPFVQEGLDRAINVVRPNLREYVTCRTMDEIVSEWTDADIQEDPGRGLLKKALADAAMAG